MRIAVAVMIAFAAACSADVSNPHPAHQVSVLATLGGRGATGDTVNIRMTNSGTADAYLAVCGESPRILTQQFNGTTWTSGVQNFVCAQALSGPLVLAAGSSITTTLVFETAGRFRFLISVSTSPNGGDAQQAVSNALDVP